MSAVVEFYRLTGRDHRDRSLREIQDFDFYELELNHDYIQWLFPLPEPSGANPAAPLLSPADIAAFQADSTLRAELARSFEAMLSFFGLEMVPARGKRHPRIVKADHFEDRSGVWLSPGNHNFLRITRILRSLTLLGCEVHAAAFLACLEEIYAENAQLIGPTTMQYWRRAVAGALTYPSTICLDEFSYAAGLKYSTIPAPTDARTNPRYNIGFGATFGG